MMKLDHLNLPVSDLERSRAWYTDTLGLAVEFEVPDRRSVALQDKEGFAIFLSESPEAASNGLVSCRRNTFRDAFDLVQD